MLAPPVAALASRLQSIGYHASGSQSRTHVVEARRDRLYLNHQSICGSADGFMARLVWYQDGSSLLPAALVGDPAKDYGSAGLMGDGRCGTFRPGDLRR